MLYAAFEGHESIARKLIERGASVDARAPNQSTPLMLAARNGHKTVVQVLLKAGADPTLVNENGLTAAAWARANNNTDIAELIEARTGPTTGKPAAGGGNPGGRKMKVLIE